MFDQTKKSRKPVSLINPVFLLFWSKRKEKNRISTNPKLLAIVGAMYSSAREKGTFDDKGFLFYLFERELSLLSRAPRRE